MITEVRHFSKQGRKPSLWILIAMVSVGPFGDTEYIPSLPDIAHYFHTSYAMAQYTMTTYLIGFAFFQLVYGIFSDRYGRRPLMLCGALIFICGSLICYLSQSMAVLLAGRCLQGMGSCAGAILSNASVRDAFPLYQRGKIYAFVNAAFAISPGVAPIIGTFISQWYPWRMHFLLLLIMSAVLFICVWFFYPETNSHKDPDALQWRGIKRSYLALWHDPYFLYYVAVMGACIGVVYSCLTEAPALTLIQMQLPPHAVTIIALGVMFGFIFGSLLASQLIRIYQPNTIIILGLVIMLITAMSMGLCVYFNYITLFSMLGPIIIIFSGIALVHPMGMTQALIPFESMAGVASAVVGCIQMALASLGTVLISVIRNDTAHAMPMTFVILSSVGLCIFLLCIVRRPDQARVYH